MVKYLIHINSQNKVTRFESWKKTAKTGYFQTFLLMSANLKAKILIFLTEFIKHIIKDIPANVEKDLASRSDFICRFVNSNILKIITLENLPVCKIHTCKKIQNG
jgi:hypothetical protein